MKNAAKCDTQCELQNSASHQIFERKWRWIGDRLKIALAERGAQRLVACEPGDLRLRAEIEDAARAAGVALEWREDTHFLCSRERFTRWAKGRKELRMEFFYREMRREHGVLMEGSEPAGGRWNFDADNREGCSKAGPGDIPAAAFFEPDRVTREVFEVVNRHFADHPGSLASFAWPVTREQALEALQRFIEARLVNFGRWQDAMWSGTPWGWHALIASSLNLHLLDPREVIAAAERAWREGRADLASVEGFIRQILGWREFIRGAYFHEMPALKQANHYSH